MSILAVASKATAQGSLQVPVPDGTTTVQTDTTGDVPTQPSVTVPEENPVPVTPPVVLPSPAFKVQTLLIKQVRRQIVLYRKSTWRWQRLMGQRISPGGKLSSVTTLAGANRALAIWRARSRGLHAAATRWMHQRILVYRRTVEHQRLVMGLKPNVRTLAAGGSLEEQFQRWHQNKNETQRLWEHPPDLSQLNCIHSHEGSWSDTGYPFWGGLQMNRAFMAAYGAALVKSHGGVLREAPDPTEGGKITLQAFGGEANLWTPLEQIWTAEKAVRSRGFEPWPNTARMCGLL